MNIINKVTLAHLKMNKGRTLITLLGIIISVALITAVITGGASYLRFDENAVINETGNWHFYLQGYSEEELEALKNDKRIAFVGICGVVNKGADGVKLPGAESERLGTGFIYRGDSVWLAKTQPFHSITGTYPATPHELLVRRQYIEKNNLDWQVGDDVTVTTGCRMLGGDMLHFPISGTFQYSETFEADGDQTFRLAGIINDDCSEEALGEMYSYLADDDGEAYVTLKIVTPFSMLTIQDIAQTYGYNLHEHDTKKAKQIFLNDSLLATHLCGDVKSEMMTLVLPMLLIVLLIIIIASVALIYNAFGMSLNERVRYLGMLSSVGATAKQRKQSVYFEGLLLGAVGIPCGLLGGIGIAAALAKAAGKLGGFLGGTRFENTKIQLVVSPWSFLIIVALSALMLFLSSRAPAKKAAAVTPIDAVKTGREVKLTARKLKSSQLIRKLFGYEGELANKNMKRNGRRGRLIIASLAISVVLFISVNYFCYIFAETKAYNEERPYQVEVDFGDSRQYKEFCAQLMAMEDVKRVYSVEEWFYGYDSRLPVQEVYSEEEYDSYDIFGLWDGDPAIAYHGNTTSKYSHLWEGVQLYIHFIEDADFNRLCKDNGLNPQDYYLPVNTMSNTKKALLLNNVQLEEGEDDVFTEGIIGETVSPFYEDPILDSYNEETQEYEFFHLYNKEQFMAAHPDEDENDFIAEYEIAGMVKYDKDNYVFKLCHKRTISCFVPLSMSPPFQTEAIDGDEWPLGVSIGVECDNHREVTEQINRIFDNADEEVAGSRARDVEYYAEQSRTVVVTLKIFLYAFLILITLITLANIVNSISTSLMLRKKEFAMLKSVGVTPKGFQKMIALECLLYGVKALAIGLPLSVGVSLLINRIVGEGTLPYAPNLLLYMIVILAVFLLVGVTMLYGVRKTRNETIIEALKDDMI